jgi:hypothetical protein
MAYIARNQDGSIRAVCGVLQPEFAEEWLPDDDPNVIAYLNPNRSVDSVSARQFKLQLLSAGLLNQVDVWVKTQSQAVQIAYEYSGSFVRTEPMMAAGFAAMGFTNQQIDDFFNAASKL